MSSHLTRVNRFTDWNILSFAIFILGAIALLPPFVISAQGTGTDFSYMQAMNWIWTHDRSLTFGTDIAYTYGPLGFLCFKVASNWPLCLIIFIFDIYMYINFLLILKAFMPLRTVLTALSVLFSILFFDKQFGEATYYLVFMFSIFVYFKTADLRFLINAAFISVLCFFIKVNFGLVQLFLLFAVIVYAVISVKTNRKYLIVLAFASVIILLLLAFALHVNIITYVRTSLDIISGYNETMVLPISMASKRFLLALLFLIVYNLIALFYLLKSGLKPESFIRYFITALFIFIIFKYSYTRAEPDKVPHAFFPFIVVGLAIQYLFEEGSFQTRIKEMLLINFFIAGSTYFSNHQFLGRPEILEGCSVEFFKDLAGEARHKFTFPEEIKNGRVIPDSIIKKIGGQTVDLMPYNLSLIFINNLNYCPRPTLQSFTAYTPTLDSFNCKKYYSSTAPEFVLFNCSSIDGRAPFWDEPATKRALCQNYNVVDSFYIDDAYNNGYKATEKYLQKYLLLKKNTSQLMATVSGPQTGELMMNEDFKVDTGAIPQYMYANFEYSAAGKLKGLLFQPSLVYVVFTYANGKTDSVRALRPIMQSGVLINKKLISADDADLLFETNGAGNEKVKSVKFVPTDNYSFKNKAKYHTELISYSKN